MKKKHFLLNLLLDLFFILAGTFIFAAGLYFFITPSNIAPGGVSGICILLNYLFGVPIGVMNAVINIPLLLIAFRMIGKEFIWKTLLSVASFTFFYDWVLAPFPVYEGERLLSSIFGGALVGIGLGLVFIRAGSTGGMDIVNKLIQRRLPHFQLGRVSFATDFVIVLLSILVYKTVESALYAIICIFVTAQAMDMVLYGGDKGKLLYIFSEKSREIADTVMEKVGRGTSFLKGEGGYTGKDKKILLVAVRRNEYHTVKRIVHEADKDAFIVVTDSSEVMGEGFKPLMDE